MSYTNYSPTLMPVAFMLASLHYFERITKISIFEKNNIHCYFLGKLLDEFD